MTTLRVLYLDRNMLTHVGGLEGCGALDTLHVTSNQLQRLDCLPPRYRRSLAPWTPRQPPPCGLLASTCGGSTVLTRSKINERRESSSHGRRLPQRHYSALSAWQKPESTQVATTAHPLTSDAVLARNLAHTQPGDVQRCG